MIYAARIQTPFGPAMPAVNERGELLSFGFGESLPATAREEQERLSEVARQVSEYFEHRRQRFDLPLARQGTEFQRQVWAMLMEIPYGETTTYGALARRLGSPDACRAVGRANATNPIALIVPCHRVIGTNGRLTGYAGGLDLKSRLLEFERSYSLFG